MANKFALTAQMVLTPPKNLGQVASQIQNQFKGVNANFDIKANPQQMAQITDGLKSISVESKKAKKEYSALADVIGAGARRFAAITLVTSTFIGLTRSIKRSLGDAIEFERKLTTLSQVTGKTVGQLGDLRDEINRISKAFGVSSDGLLDTATTLSQAGYTARQVKDSLEVLAKSELAASFDNVQNTTEGAIAILSQFRREASKAGGEVKFLEQSLGAINDVSKAYAVESADLITAIRQTGGSFEAAGGSLNELLGVFTSVRATTRESAETIATGLRTIFTRIQRVDTINALKQLGVELQDVEGKFVGPFEAIQRISKGLSSIDTRDIRFASIVEELGGFRQIGKVIPLIKQQKLGVEALSTALRANDSLTQDAAIAQTSLANKISVVKEEFQDLVRNFQDSKTFQQFANFGLKLAKAFIGVASSLEKLLPLLATLAKIQFGKTFAELSLGAIGLFGKKKPIQRNTGGGVPGTGSGDTVPAMLTPGEFVMRKSAVQSIGVNRLSQMNRTGDTGDGIQYLAVGGIVDKIGSVETGSKIKTSDLLRTNNKGKYLAGVSGYLLPKIQKTKNWQNEDSTFINYNTVEIDPLKSKDEGLKDNYIRNRIVSNDGKSYDSLSKEEKSIKGTAARDKGYDFENIVYKHTPKATRAKNNAFLDLGFGEFKSDKKFGGHFKGSSESYKKLLIKTLNSREKYLSEFTEGVDTVNPSKSNISLYVDKYRHSSPDEFMKAVENSSNVKKQQEEKIRLNKIKEERSRFFPEDDRETQYFADGGEVRFSPKRNKFGGFFLNPFGGGNATIDTGANGLLLDAEKTSVQAILERFQGLSTKYTEPTKEELIKSDPITVLSNAGYVRGEKRKNGVLTSEAYKPMYDYVNKSASEFQAKNPTISLTDDKSKETQYYKGLIYENAVKQAKEEGIIPPTSGQLPSTVGLPGDDRTDFKLSNEAMTIKSHFDGMISNVLAGEVDGQSRLKKGIESGPSTIPGVNIDKEQPKNSTRVRIVAQKKVPALFPSGEGVKEGYQERIKQSVTSGVEGMIESFSQNIVGDIGPFDLDKARIRESALGLLKDQSAIGSISGYIFEGVVAGLTGAKIEGQGATFDFLTKDNTSVFTRLFNNVPKEMEAADAKATKESGENILTQKIPAFLASVGKENMSSYLDNIAYFNTGGLARGTDTVPAMLTPGEFVINRDAAQAIGYDRLAQMNSGDPQYFSRGGMVNKRNNMSTKEKELADASSINNMYQGSSYAAGASNKDNIKIKFASEKASKEFIELSNELVKIKASGQEVSVAFKVFARELTKGTSAKDAKDFAIQSTYSSGPNTPSGRLRSVTPTRSVDQGAGEIRQAGTFNLNQNQVAQSLSTVVGNKDLPKAMSAYVREIQRGGTEQQAMNEAVIAGERAQRDRINKEFRTKENTERGKSLQASKDYGSGPPSSPPSSPLTPEQAAQNAAISAQNTTNADEKISKFVQSVGSAAFTFGFLATSISSVISQYGFLDDAMAESVSRVTTTFATVFATGQTLVGFLSNFKNATLANVVSQNTETIANNAATVSENAKTAANIKSTASSNIGIGAASSMSKITLGLTGVVAGVSAGMAIAEYYSTQYSQAQEKANTKIKEFTKELETNGKGDASQLAALQKEALTNEAKATGASSAGLYGAVGAGATGAIIGGIIGSFALPVIGTAIGAGIGSAIGGGILGTAGGYVGSKYGSNNASLSETSMKSIEESSNAQVGATSAIYNFQRSVELAELANLGSSEKLFKINASTEEFVKSYKDAEARFRKAEELRNLDSLARGDTKNIALITAGILTGNETSDTFKRAPLTPEQEKQKLADETVLQNLREQAKKAEDIQRKSIFDTSGDLIERGTSKDDLFKILDAPIKNFKDTLDINRPKEDATIIFDGANKSLTDMSEASDRLRISQEAVNKAYAAQRDAILSVNSGLRALSKISDIENGIETSLSNFISSLDGGAASFKLSVSSGFADITNVPDQDSFAKDINSIVGIIGPQVRKLGDSVINASSIFQKAESVLLNRNLTSLEGVQPGAEFESSVTNVADKIFQDIGVDPLQLGEMGTIIKENLKKAIIDKKGGGYIDNDTIRTILAPLIGQGQDGAKLLSGLIEQQQRKVIQHSQLIDKLNELSRTEVEIRQGIVDSQERLFNNIASVDPNITPEQKQVQNQRFRDARAGAASARFGVRNPNDVGAILSKVLGNKEKLAQLRKEADLTTINANRLQFLNKTITDLSGQTLDATNRLKELSNQSDKTADILAKLDKIRAGKEQIKSKADSFIFGSDEERADIQRSFEYLDKAMRQGNLAGFDDDQRKAIGSLLSDLGDTKIGRNGENGNDIRSMLSVNEAVRNGANRGTAQAVFGKDLISSEQAIINELNAVAKAETEASNALAAINGENKNAVLENTKAIIDNTKSMAGFLGNKIDPLNLPAKNTGGVVGNAGSKIRRPGGDNRLVTMRDDEFVITGEGREFIGDDFLYGINNRNIPGFAKGGPKKKDNKFGGYSSKEGDSLRSGIRGFLGIDRAKSAIDSMREKTRNSLNIDSASDMVGSVNKSVRSVTGSAGLKKADGIIANTLKRSNPEESLLGEIGNKVSTNNVTKPLFTSPKAERENEAKIYAESDQYRNFDPSYLEDPKYREELIKKAQMDMNAAKFAPKTGGMGNQFFDGNGFDQSLISMFRGESDAQEMDKIKDDSRSGIMGSSAENISMLRNFKHPRQEAKYFPARTPEQDKTTADTRQNIAVEDAKRKAERDKIISPERIRGYAAKSAKDTTSLFPDSKTVGSPEDAIARNKAATDRINNAEKRATDSSASFNQVFPDPNQNKIANNTTTDISSPINPPVKSGDSLGDKFKAIDDKVKSNFPPIDKSEFESGVSSPVGMRSSNSIGKKTGNLKNENIRTGMDARRQSRIQDQRGMLPKSPERGSQRKEMLENNRKSAEAEKARRVEEYKAGRAVKLGGSDTFNPDTNKFTTTNKRGDFVGSRDATPQQLEQRKQVQAQQAQQGQNGAQGANGQQPVINFAEGAKTLQDALNASLNRIPELFTTTNTSIATFVTALEGISKTFNGMKMEHTVTVGGQVTLGGINLPDIAKTITDSVSTAIGGLVGSMINEKLKDFKPV